MYRSFGRQERSLKAELTRNLGLFFFENREIYEILKELDTLARAPRHKALALCVHLSNISGNIVPRIVGLIAQASLVLPAQDLERWISEAFDILDAKGIEPVVSFLSKNDRKSLAAFLLPKGLYLEAIAPRLETYVRGISGADFRIRPSYGHCYTDTADFYLPAGINIFREQEKNFLMYKLISSHLWGQMEYGTFSKMALSFLDGLGEKELALDLYRVLEAVRVEEFLKAELPGLMRQALPLKKQLLEKRPSPEELDEKTAFVESLYRQYLLSGTLDPDVLAYREGEFPDLAAFNALYARATSLTGTYSPLGPEPLPYGILPEKVLQCLQSRKERLRKKLQGFISRIMRAPDLEQELRKRTAGKPLSEVRPDMDNRFVLLKGALLKLDDELAELMSEGEQIPGAVLTDGSGTGAAGAASLRSLIDEEEDSADETAEGGIRYDEWDYMRTGYRKGWCVLFEHDVHPLDEPFVESTLRAYGGYVNSLRKKFELLRNESRILKRQKEGEDIDIDAAVEAVADFRAGLSPGEHLFTKLSRDQRNIATLFLLDMSGSTKGWINTAEKEALVLMCEAMESLRDRYAIYGFSGMTRTRCDFYRVKSFSDGYSDEVRKRIAGIMPKDYTRMGPAIRHAGNILKSVEARTKFLIALSDGKPEDYDAYKGPYGIEDTRKALVEAKQQGIHSFCITIDREAHEYLPHMYGEVNYTFIDDVRKLPAKITDIYTRLTT